jgi:protein-S-isoprenylcysteine O-methyltransferase
VSSRIAFLLSMLFTASEIGLGIFRRAAHGAGRTQGGAPWLLYGVVGASVTLGFYLAAALPSLDFGSAWTLLGYGVFAAGVALRWYAIGHLGRFFTVNVAIASDHRLIDSGPYRWIRHPSYTGLLSIVLGLALTLHNWAALLVMLVPSLLIFLRRIRIEEQALIGAFGDDYRDYMRRTKRLIPALY